MFALIGFFIHGSFRISFFLFPSSLLLVGSPTFLLFPCLQDFIHYISMGYFVRSDFEGLSYVTSLWLETCLFFSVFPFSLHPAAVVLCLAIDMVRCWGRFCVYGLFPCLHCVGTTGAFALMPLFSLVFSSGAGGIGILGRTIRLIHNTLSIWMVYFWGLNFCREVCRCWESMVSRL